MSQETVLVKMYFDVNVIVDASGCEAGLANMSILVSALYGTVKKTFEIPLEGDPPYEQVRSWLTDNCFPATALYRVIARLKNRVTAD